MTNEEDEIEEDGKSIENDESSKSLLSYIKLLQVVTFKYHDSLKIYNVENHYGLDAYHNLIISLLKLLVAGVLIRLHRLITKSWCL